MCTHNLHYLNCRAFAQESAHGPMANNTEGWIERMIKQLKQATAGKVTKAPERTFVQVQAMKQALEAAAILYRIRPPQEWSSAVQ